MAGPCGVTATTLLLLLVVVCLLAPASGLVFPRDRHYSRSTDSSTANWHSYDPEAVVAVHLGNTNSCVAGYGNRTADTMFRFCVPSWVAFPADGGVLVGEAAKNYADTDPEAAVFGFKRVLGLRRNNMHEEDTVQGLAQRVPYTIGSRGGVWPVIRTAAKDGGAAAGKELYVQEVATMVIAELRKKAQGHLGGSTVSFDAVVTVPAHSNYASKQAARDAGRMAWLDVVGTVAKPVAAAVAYGLREKLRVDGNALVLHVGGGTAGASVVTLTDGGDFEVLASRNDPFLGGDDFDRRIVDHFVDLIRTKHGEDIGEDRRALRKLGMACERAKRALSSQDHAQVSVESLFAGGMDFSESLSRPVFEELNDDLFRKVIALVEAAMEESELERSKIDEVILVGGSTMIPKIRRLVKDYFDGKEPSIGLKPDEVAATGAAVEIRSLKYWRFGSLD